jgi:hydrogenase/urease accessory protein HupE
MRRRFVVALLALAAGALWGPADDAHAHAARLSSSEVRIAGGVITSELQLNLRDLEAVIGAPLRPEGAPAADAAQLSGGDSHLVTEYVTRHVALRTRDGRACVPQAQTPRAEGEHVRLRIRWRCPSVHGDLLYRVTLFHDIDPGARHLLVVPGGEGVATALLGVSAPEAPIAGPAPSWPALFGHYLVFGVRHIFLGYDHVAFLLGIILWGSRLRQLVWAVTAFTLAHSITLALSVLNLVVLPDGLVEIVIAASIVYVALENFFVRDTRDRWRLALVFGLAHGFGFAGALRALGLPAGAVAPALAGFNVGVELGQIAILALVLPLLTLVNRVLPGSAGGQARSPALVYSCSAVVLFLGTYWLIERSVFLVAMG